jgi:3-methyladenine DNA glycosylase AlkD
MVRLERQFDSLSEIRKTLDVEKLESEILQRLKDPEVNTTAEIRRVRREFSKQLAKVSPELITELALRLVTKSSLTPRFVAYELVLHHKAALRSIDSQLLEKLGRGIGSWAEVDTFACYVAGPVWREHQVPDALIMRWARSNDRWLRRAAIVSTVPLNNRARGGDGDTARTLLICELVVSDRDDLVVKALSWALRELAKSDASAVRVFLRDHMTRLAPRVQREVKNKLSTGLKNPRKHKRQVD